MSIRGIDAQIMISRLPDNVNEASALQRRPEVSQEFMAVQARINDAHDQTKVQKTLETEMENIRTDVDEDGSGGGGGGSHGPGKDGEEEAPSPDLLVPPSNHIIDIKV
jgi:hypothetical protein